MLMKVLRFTCVLLAEASMRGLLCLVLLAVCLFNSIAWADNSQFTGYAYDLRSGELCYQEQHFRRLDEQGQQQIYTRYIDPQNKVIAKRTVSYDGDQVVEFVLQDQRSQQIVSAIRSTDKVVVQKKALLSAAGDAHAQETLKTTTLKLKPSFNNVIDAGFNSYLLSNWQRLVSGEVLSFNFLSTERASWIKFRLKDGGLREEDGYPVRRFVMTVTNPMFRLLLKPIKVDYYADTKELFRYQGISNIKRENGKNYNVRIEFPRSGYQVTQLNAAKPQ